jgi:hypothetical protein
MNSKTARLAGLFFLLMVVFGLFSEIIFRQKIFVESDAAQTAENILSNEILFRIGIGSDLLMSLSYLITVLLLHKLFSSVNKHTATAMVVIAAVGSVILTANVLYEFAPLVILDGNGPLAALGTDQLNALALFFYQLYQHGYMIGQIFFALWVLPLGLLIIESKRMPKVLGIFFIVETIFGLLAVGIHFLIPNGTLESIAMIPMMVAEFSFMFYLLIRGCKK